MTHEAGELTQAHLEHLPMFPLPRLTFFPHTRLPLHIFEARYRSLTAWCLERDWPMAVVMIEPGHEAEQPGDPPVVSVAGVGRIAYHRELPNGRYNLVLEGLGRVRIEEELHSAYPFRVVRASRVVDLPVADPSALTQGMSTLRGCLSTLVQQHPSVANVLGGMLSTHDDETLVDHLAATLFPEEQERQALLELTSSVERLDRLVARLADLLVRFTQDDQSH